MKTVDLSLLAEDADFIGIIMPMKSGIIWTNQSGGTCCAHPELEGVYIPLGSHHYAFDESTKKDPLCDYVTTYKRELVEAFLDVTRLKRAFAPVDDVDALPVLFGAGIRLLEAWVPVRVACPPDQLKDWQDAWGVIVYPNSD